MSVSIAPSVEPSRSLALALFSALSFTAACLTPPAGTAASSPVEPAAATTVSTSASVSSIPYVWKSVAISGGGFVTGLAFSPVQAGIFYARTDIGGAYRYVPGERRWVPLTDWLGREDASFMGIESIAPDPVNADRVYMAVGMYAQPWDGTGAFMRSDNRGDTWRVTRMPGLEMGGNDLGRGNGERLTVDPHQPSILFFGSRRSGLWKSGDEAETWSAIDSFPVQEDPKGLGIPFVVFDPRGKAGEATKLVYAGVSRFEDNLYRSNDAGQTWQLVPEQPRGFMPSRAAIDRDGTLYVSYGNDPGPFAVQDGALHRFQPEREIWTDISPIKPSKSDGFGYGAVTVDPSHPGTVVATTIDRWGKGGEIFRSRDTGNTWQPLFARAVFDAAGVAHVYHHKDELGTPQWMADIKIDPFSPDHAAVVEGGGVWITEDLTQADRGAPTRWTYRTENLEETGARALISPPEGAPLLSMLADLCGFRHDSLEESPKHGNFENPTCASGDAIDFAGKKPAFIARVGNDPWNGNSRKVARGAVSNDGGRAWTPFRSEPAGSNGSGSIAVSADGATIVWAARDAQVSRSTGHGATWVAAKGLPPPAKVADWAPVSTRVAADRVNPKKFYAVDLIGGKAYVSEDGGASFELTTATLTPLPDYNLVVGSIQTVLGFEGHVWVTGGKELFRSSDSGRSFSAVPNVEEAYAVGFGRPAPGQAYSAIYLSGKIAGVAGFFRSDDAGASFVRINDDAHQFGGTNIIVGDPRVYGRAYVAGGGRGILYGEPE